MQRHTWVPPHRRTQYAEIPPISLRVRPVYPGLHVASLTWAVFSKDGDLWRKCGAGKSLDEKFVRRFGFEVQSDTTYDGYQILPSCDFDCLVVALDPARNWVLALVANFFEFKEHAEDITVIRNFDPQECDQLRQRLAEREFPLTTCSTPLGVFQIAG